MNKKKISNCVEHKDDINQQVQPTHKCPKMGNKRRIK